MSSVKGAKRISQSKIDWKALSERVPPEQKVQFANLKMKNDAYVRKVSAYPPEMPKLDWEKYKKSVPIGGMVDNFKEQLGSLKIDFPPDKLTPQIEEQWQKVKKEVADYCQSSEKRISEYQKEVSAIKAKLPFDEMNLEDFKDAYPDEAIDPVNRPSFWPHNDQEQPGYKPPEIEVAPPAAGGKAISAGGGKPPATPAKPAPKK